MHIVTDDGTWVSETFHRLAEIVKDYDPYLEMAWIPPGQRSTEEEKKNPYLIRDTRSDYIVMFISERETPEGILERLFMADNKHGSVLDRMEARNAAQEVLRLKEKLDEEELKKDFAAFLIGSKQNYIKTKNPITGETLKLDDQLRRI